LELMNDCQIEIVLSGRLFCLLSRRVKNHFLLASLTKPHLG
jgi:hypothetical protein